MKKVGATELPVLGSDSLGSLQLFRSCIGAPAQSPRSSTLFRRCSLATSHQVIFDHRSIALRRQTSDALAQRLDTASHVGNFYRLRQIAVLRFFGPVAQLVRDGRVGDVQAELLTLQQRFIQGDLERELIESFGDARDLRPAHRQSLKRYIEQSIAAIATWLKQEHEHERRVPVAGGDRLLEEIRAAAARLPNSIARPDHHGDAGTLVWIRTGCGGVDRVNKSEQVACSGIRILRRTAIDRYPIGLVPFVTRVAWSHGQSGLIPHHTPNDCGFLTFKVRRLGRI